MVIGAGPAGLTAGWRLAERGESVIVLEAQDQVGGLARTVQRGPYRFDLGGHRFFTKTPEIEELWWELLGDELLERPRKSRIRWRGRFIDYPLSISSLLEQIGPLEIARSGASYAVAHSHRHRQAESFEEWVSQRFGRRLYDLFFRCYTEKVWGVPGDQISADWAAQRIRELSLGKAVRSAFRGNRDRHLHSLIGSFLYPRLGPGQMWEAMRDRIEAAGGEVRLSTPVIGLDTGPNPTVQVPGETVRAKGVISTLPLRTLAGMADSPTGAVEAASGLRYRDFLTVALVTDDPDPFPDNWVYVHDPEVMVGRIQNFRSWSPSMVGVPGHGCLGLEYFCFEGDSLWNSEDRDLIELAGRELRQVGLLADSSILEGHVVRVPKAYPIYDDSYAERVQTLRSWLDEVPSLVQIGRNGLHRYNNVDHSMLCALRAVENLLDGAEHDLWAINADNAFHESTEPDLQPYRNVPETPAQRLSPAEEAAALADE